MTDIRTNAPGVETRQPSVSSNAGLNQRVGTFKAAEVRVIDQSSLIADATEELTSAMSEETEKDVSDREVEDGRKADSLERLLQLSEINELMKSLGDLNKRDLHRALKALLKHQSKGPQVLRRQAEQEFKEPSHQYAALKSLVETLKARRAPTPRIDAAERALSGLMEEHGAAIKAAVNVGAAAGAYAKGDLGTVPELRDAYRTNVHDYHAISDVIDDLVTRFGEGKLKQSIGFMLSALAGDLESAGSSIDKTHLGLIMSDMNRLKTMSTMLGNCDLLMQNAIELGAKSSFTPVSLLRDIAPLQDAARVLPDQITAIPVRAGLNDIEHQIRFINDLHEVVRLIPLESYEKVESRTKLLKAIDDALIEKGDLELELEGEDE